MNRAELIQQVIDFDYWGARSIGASRRTAKAIVDRVLLPALIPDEIRSTFFVALDADDAAAVWRLDPSDGLPYVVTYARAVGSETLWAYLTAPMLVLIDRQGEPIDGLYGCECDDGRPCSAAQCVMDRALDERSQRQLYRGARQAGLVPEGPQ